MRVWPRICSAAFAASFGALACSSTPTAIGVIPTTGITLRASDLTAGIGCGTGDGQVYKYAAVLTEPNAGGVYDCFADAAFVNLPAIGDGGVSVYEVTVYLYDKQAYDAHAADIQGAAGASNANQFLSGVPATWTTTCTATQTLDIQTVADCKPRTAGGFPGTMRVSTASFPVADGGAATCGAEYDGFSASTSATADAGTAITSCSATPSVDLGPFQPFSQASATVTLYKGIGIFGTTTCHAKIEPGLDVDATCDPVNTP